MREIKFRAWDTMFNYGKGGMIEWDNLKSQLESCFRSPVREEVILMQYTGLKDKNGKEIYEGDIVNYILDGQPLIMNGVITWNENRTSFYGECNERFDLFRHKDVQYEVIGNIYENT